MIETTIENWHKFLRGDLPGGLDQLLHDDVVFYSPVVYTPQKGKAITSLYLQAAAGTLNEPSKTESAQSGETDEGSNQKGSFRYVTEVVSGNTAVLEFETSIDGKYVNGIDMITCDEQGQIIEFKVMVRPLQAVHAIHQAMKSMLEQLSG